MSRKKAGAAPGLTTRQVDIRTSIRPTVAEVDLGALRRNVERLRRIAGPKVALYGVVKADAYGHGAAAVGKVLGPLCDALAVSLVEEGLELRAAGIKGPIVVLGAYYDRYQSEVLEHDLTPVVYDRGDLERFGEAPVRRRPAAVGAPVAIHLKVDTGMNRLGVPVDELPAFFERARAFPRVRIEGLCTHLASADLADAAVTKAQLRLFARALGVARPRAPHLATIHAANSAAAVRFPEARFDAIRPGLALYGAMPSVLVARPDLEPVLNLRTKIMAVHDVKVGQGVSYGGAWRAQRRSRVATLPVGYADGYPRHVRGAQTLVRGSRAPVAGAVCMDMMMIDVTDVPGATLGDQVTLIGGDQGTGAAAPISIDELALWAGTVNYEILCGLSKRVPRIYTATAAR